MIMKEHAEAEQALAAEMQRHRAYLLYSPEGSALMMLARQVIAAKNAEIARLLAENDEMAGRDVEYCMDREVEHARNYTPGTLKDGHLLRTTDTFREFEYRGGTWTEG
jgi:hypothetical protein